MYKPLVFFLLTACSFSVDGGVAKDTSSSYWDTDTGSGGDTAEDACDTADTASLVEEVAADRLLHVDESSAYSGIDVEVLDGQMVLKSACDDDRVEGWVVNSTQSEELVNLPTDVADFTYTGPSGSYAGYKIYQIVSDTGPNPLEMVCFTQDYTSTYAENGGSLACVRKSDITAGHSLTEADAVFVAHFNGVNAYAGTGAVAEDFDGDGNTDLLMGGGADGVLSIDYDAFSVVKTATTFPVVKVYPFDADPGKTFTVCDENNDGVNDGSYYCQAQLYVASSHSLIVTDDSYQSGIVSSLVESYDLSVWPPNETGQMTMGIALGGPNGTNVEYIPAYDYVGINVWYQAQWLFLDPVTLFTEWMVDADSGCGAYGIETGEIDGDPYMWLGCTESPGAGTRSGEVWAFNIAAGMPGDTSDADFVLTESDTSYGGVDMDLGTSVDGQSILAVGNERVGGTGSNNGMNVYSLYTDLVCPE